MNLIDLELIINQEYVRQEQIINNYLMSMQNLIEQNDIEIAAETVKMFKQFFESNIELLKKAISGTEAMIEQKSGGDVH